jgi:hypothetical protein
MHRYVLLVFVLLSIISLPSTLAQDSNSLSGSVVLALDGEISHMREGWKLPAPIQVGSFIGWNDVVFPGEANLLILCPDGNIEDFVAGELFVDENDKLNCEVPLKDHLVNVNGIQRFDIQRGGKQDVNIPYLIAPRRTLIRTRNLKLRWNALLNVQEYQIQFFADGRKTNWPQMRFSPNDVTQGGTASAEIALDLQPDVPYTVQICVLFQNTQEACTTGGAWSSGTDLAFVYVPDPVLGNLSLASLESEIIANLGENTPESLYARAVLLSQPNTRGLGFNMEAIDLLNRLGNNHSESSLGKSPDLYLRLGNLYREIELPRSAAMAFQDATELSTVCTETAAQAYWGLGLTAPSEDMRVSSLNESLEIYYCLLEPTDFALQYAQLCKLLVDRCSVLRTLENFME